MDKSVLLELQNHLVAGALAGTEEAALVHGMCDRLVAHGVPLWRAMAAMDELHPLVEGRVVTWRRGEENTAMRAFERAEWANRQDEWLRSPLYRLHVDKALRLRRRRGDSYRQGEFSIVDELFAKGAADYLAYRQPYADAALSGDTDCLFMSCASDRREGFSDAHLAALDSLLPTLALALRARSVARSARNLVTTYLGRDAGERVLHGQIERGKPERVCAVLWFSDLAGFTRIADAAPDQIVPLLNDYADCQVGAIHAHGGQVLKFVGDGILAIFPIDDVPAACRRALDAAATSLGKLAALNRRRGAAGLPTTRFYLALHVGEVLYGNIGSPERLDFTVVGPAVNEVSRIEAMCKSLDRDVLLSADFAAAAGGAGLVSVGRYALRGVGRAQELFTLDADAA